MYTTEWCGYCVRAKQLLEKRGIEYEEVHMDEDPEFRQKLLDLTGRWTVPQIFVDGRAIGGYMELSALDRTGGLDELVSRGRFAMGPRRRGWQGRMRGEDAGSVRIE